MQALSWALRQRRISPVAKLVLIYLADSGAASEWRDIDAFKIADFVGCSVGIIEEVLAELEMQGLCALTSSGQVAIPSVEVAKEQRKPIPPRPGQEPITKEVRERILERYGYVCIVCDNTDGPFQVDHIVPRCKGGTNDESNLQLLCKECNVSKGGKDFAEWLAQRSESDVNQIRQLIAEGKYQPDPKYIGWVRAGRPARWGGDA